MKTLKSIDGKSMLIGCLLATTIFFATGATGITDKWSTQQQWEFGHLMPPRANKPEYLLMRKMLVPDGERFRTREMNTLHYEWPKGWEPVFTGQSHSLITVRRRIK